MELLIYTAIILFLCVFSFTYESHGALLGQNFISREVFSYEKLLERDFNRGRVLRRELLTASPCNSTCINNQLNFLNSFFIITNGQYWTEGSSNWSTLASCQRKGVSCCDDNFNIIENNVIVSSVTMSNVNCSAIGAGFIVGLRLPSNNLTGNMSDVFNLLSSYNLPYLKFIYLQHNNIYGDFKPTSSLPNLRVLSLTSNNLNGTLTSDYWMFPNMLQLSLSYNSLNGGISSNVTSMQKLEWLDLSLNKLTGAISSSFFTSMPRLRALFLADNSFSGTIPSLQDIGVTDVDISANSSLELLDLSNNSLSGSIPNFFPLLPLTTLMLSFNNFSGTLEDLIVGSVFLTYLDLQNNSLSGTVPSIFRPIMLQTLILSNNSLSGTLPAALGYLYELRIFSINGNAEVTGSLPSTFVNLKEIAYINIYNTSLVTSVVGGGSLTTSAGEALGIIPSFLNFKNFGSISLPDDVMCPEIAFRSNALQVYIPPYYYQYRTCYCSGDDVLTFVYELNSTLAAIYGVSIGSNGTAFYNSSSAIATHVVTALCVHKNQSHHLHWWIYLIIGIVCAIVLTVLGALAVVKFLPVLNSYQSVKAKRSPPGVRTNRRGGGYFGGGRSNSINMGSGAPVVTLVMTDVEGSTELWEWDTGLMAEAIELHDRTIRAHMSAWSGYEVQTEGDAFLVAFHEPADAVGWAITTQLALLNREWPRELFRHHKACIETVGGLLPDLSSKPPSMSPTPNRVSFSGEGGGGGSKGVRFNNQAEGREGGDPGP
uniref:Guanylate cyclase domain-containing protein n=1 Tax=Polytomella parva TaxID=51329 RepID=A0A7S0UVR3_9CHLO|mmetsp:Transcript_18726/g.33996  ORF Transcript_18726/g.33996 Transcript_18726/m.33996 type:complete len:766 (+) Transcript_18726:70-2367(+)